MDAQSGGHFLAGREGAAGFPELASPVESLGPEVDELRALAHRLQAENHQFRQQAGYRSSRHRNNLKRINTLERKVCGHCCLPEPLLFSESLLFPTKRPFSTGEKLVLYELVRAVVS